MNRGVQAAAARGLFAFGDEECAALAERHGTPMFAYSAARASEAYAALRQSLPPRARIAYAVKANPHPALLAHFARLGAAFDCASIGELERVAALGVARGGEREREREHAREREQGSKVGRILFAGPGKRRHELARALELGARVQAEGWEDLERLDELAARGATAAAGDEVRVHLRVHPAGGVEEQNRIIGGAGPSAFGVDEEDAPAVIERARGLARVRIRGLHVFAASNERDANRLLATHARVLEIARELQELVGAPFDAVDLGGGLGVPYNEDEQPLDVAYLGAGLAQLLREHTWFTGELVLEPGRFLAARAGVYLVRVVRVKESRGELFAILEAGINHLLRPLLIGQPFPVRAVGKRGPTRETTLAGPLCTSLDRLGRVPLPELAPGDLLVFGTAGAYGFTEAATAFLSHPPALEIWVEEPKRAEG